MKNIKLFEDFNNNTINVVLDTSDSVSHSFLQEAINRTNFVDYDSIILIQVSNEVESVDNLEDVQEILNVQFSSRRGDTMLESALDYILDNNLENNSTYIISDFLESDSVDWSILPHYEKINID